MKLHCFRVISANTNFGFGNHYIAIGILVEAEGEPKTVNKDWKEWRWFRKNDMPKNLSPSAKLTIASLLKKEISVA